MQEVLHARYYNIHENNQEIYLVRTRSQRLEIQFYTKVQGIEKDLDLNLIPENKAAVSTSTITSSR